MIDFYNLVSKANLNSYGQLEFFRASDSIDEFLAFVTKDEYIAWRTEWKAAYAALSSEIRELRTKWRAEGSDHEPVLHTTLYSRRRLARLMMALRHESKRKAEQLYQQSKAASKVA